MGGLSSPGLPGSAAGVYRPRAPHGHKRNNLSPGLLPSPQQGSPEPEHRDVEATREELSGGVDRFRLPGVVWPVAPLSRRRRSPLSLPANTSRHTSWHPCLLAHASRSHQGSGGHCALRHLLTIASTSTYAQGCRGERRIRGGDVEPTASRPGRRRTLRFPRPWLLTAPLEAVEELREGGRVTRGDRSARVEAAGRAAP
jgi:hypothetical protein